MNALLIRYSGYTATFVVFLAWFINNVFVTSLQNVTQEFDAIQAEQDASADLARINDLVEGQRTLFKQVEALQSGKQNEEEMDSEWVASLESNGKRAAENARQLDNLVTRVDPKHQEDLVQGIKQSVEKTERYATEISGAAEKYRHEKARELLDTLEATNQEYKGIEETSADQYEKLNAYVTEERKSSSNAAVTASMMAYAFSALGVGLGGFGQWLGKRQKKAV